MCIRDRLARARVAEAHAPGPIPRVTTERDAVRAVVTESVTDLASRCRVVLVTCSTLGPYVDALPPVVIGGPVSYTHLDVYKRQARDGLPGQRPGRPSGGGHLAGGDPGDPRRRGGLSTTGRLSPEAPPSEKGPTCAVSAPSRMPRPRSSGSPFRPASVTSSPPVSYTHLDVYKRQSSSRTSSGA